MKKYKETRTTGRSRKKERRHSLVGRRWTDGLRRDVEQKFQEISAGPIRIVDTVKRVFVNGEERSLTPREYALLRLLATNKGRVISTEELSANLWQDKRNRRADEVKQYVYLLRRKIESDPSAPRLIRSVKGFGYVFVAEEYNRSDS